MKLFITGATGFIGSVLVDELISHGHQVIGLARSDKSADQLTKAGAEVIRGDLEDLEALKKGARESDGVLHLGFIHDFTNYQHSCDVDEVVTKTFVSELEGTNKLFIYTSGLMAVQQDIGVVSYETDVPVHNFGGGLNKRVLNEQYALAAHKKGIRAIVLRLSPTVHGKGDQAFVPQLAKIAKNKGVSYYIEEGKNVWPAIHRKDAAVLYRLAAEKGLAGSAYHVASENVETKDIASAIGKLHNVPVKSIPAADAPKELGFFGHIFSVNTLVSTEKTKKELGPWEPKEIGLIEEILTNYGGTDVYMKF